MKYLTAVLTAFALTLALALFTGCSKDEIPYPTDVENIQIDTGDWVKVPLKSNLSSFAFDSQGNIYFINFPKLYYADAYFVIKDSITIPTNGRSIYPSKIFINENDILFLAEYNGMNHQLFVSNNKGKTWFSPSGFKNTEITNFSSKGNRAYITSSSHDESTAMVQISEDNGTTWRTIKKGGYGYSACQENDYGEIFFIRSDSLFYSKDYGTIITGKAVNFIYPWENSLAFNKNNNLVLGNNSGLFITTDHGSTWQSSIENNNIDIFYTVFNTPSGNIYALKQWEINSNNCGLDGVYVSINGGIKWNSFLPKPDNYFYGTYQLSKDGYLYIITSVNRVGSLYRSKEKLF